MSECLRSLRPYASLSLSSFSFILISSLPLLSSTLSDSSSFFSRSVGCAKRSCLRKEEAFFFFSTVRGERNRRGNWFRSRTRSKDSRFSFSYRRRKGFVFSVIFARYSLSSILRATGRNIIQSRSNLPPKSVAECAGTRLSRGSSSWDNVSSSSSSSSSRPFETNFEERETEGE